MSHVFNLTMPPTANHRLMVRNGRLIKSPKMREWTELSECELLNQIRNKKNFNTIENYCDVSVLLVMPDRRKRDIDNPIKPLLDVLVKANVLKDDSLIKMLNVGTKYQKGVKLIYIYIDEHQPTKIDNLQDLIISHLESNLQNTKHKDF